MLYFRNFLCRNRILPDFLIKSRCLLSQLVLLNVESTQSLLRSTVLISGKIGGCVIEQRRGSRYNRKWKDPILSKAELEKPLEPNDPRHIARIKAPADYQCFHAFQDPMVNKFINITMKDGKKITARQLVLSALEQIKREQVRRYLLCRDEAEKATIECNPVTIFNEALRICTPICSMVRIKRGGVSYLVPCGIPEKTGIFHAMRWLREVGREKGNTERYDDVLAKEILAAFYRDGRWLKKKTDMLRVAEANKAFSHYRFIGKKR